jgi:hypothetical protein
MPRTSIAKPTRTPLRSPNSLVRQKFLLERTIEALQKRLKKALKRNDDKKLTDLKKYFR